MSFVDRIGLSLVSPREAALEARASDVAWLLAARVVAGETPRIAQALARGLEGGPMPALMGLLNAASAVLPDVLGILIGAIVLAFFVRRRPMVDASKAGAKAVADRTLDVAAAAWVPYLFVQLCGALLWSALGRPMHPVEEGVIDALAVGWSGLVWTLGLIELRRVRAT